MKSQRTVLYQIFIHVGTLTMSLVLATPLMAKTDPLNDALKKAGIKPLTTCQTFAPSKQLKSRQDLWQKALKGLPKKQKAEVHQWIIGARKPPKLVTEEAAFQRDCMLGHMTNDAADKKKRLILDFGAGVSPTKYNMKKWAKYTKRIAHRRKIGRKLTKSHVRNANSQAFIWRRKFLFGHPNNFNHISADAAKLCKFKEGNSWRPGHSRHKRCWQKTLNDHQRQREILTASSAPGISRHHWGADFDLFNLNPRKYLGKGPFADEYKWMNEHALTYGFFQPFTGTKKLGKHTYIAERWHWSYYPIAKALTQYIVNNPKQIATALSTQWTGYEKSWNRRKRKPSDYFGYVKKHWKQYMLKVAQIELAYAPWIPNTWFEADMAYAFYTQWTSPHCQEG